MYLFPFLSLPSQQQAKVQAGSAARASSGVGRMWAAACSACATVLRRTMLNGLNIAFMVIPSAVLFAVFIKCLFWDAAAPAGDSVLSPIVSVELSNGDDSALVPAPCLPVSEVVLRACGGLQQL